MKIVVQKVKKIYDKVRGLFPSRIPTGVSEFDEWAKSISSTYRMPTESYDSLVFSLSTMIMHLGPKDAYKSKYHFALALNASAAKQVAGHMFQEVKLKQKRLEEEQRTKLSEATVNTPGLSVVGQQQKL